MQSIELNSQPNRMASCFHNSSSSFQWFVVQGLPSKSQQVEPHGKSLGKNQNFYHLALHYRYDNDMIRLWQSYVGFQLGKRHALKSGKTGAQKVCWNITINKIPCIHVWIEKHWNDGEEIQYFITRLDTVICRHFAPLKDLTWCALLNAIPLSSRLYYYYFKQRFGSGSTAFGRIRIHFNPRSGSISGSGSTSISFLGSGST